jgi:hypothetical protein
MALETLCGPDDVATPDGPLPGARDVLAPKARNHAGRFNPLAEMVTARSIVDIGRIGRDFAKFLNYYKNMSETFLISLKKISIWDNYYKFCFEKNSWNKVIFFFYYYNRHHPGKLYLNEFIRRGGVAETSDRAFPSDWTRDTLDNRMIVDDVYMFDDLKRGLGTALRKAGVPENLVSGLELPRLKTETRDVQRPCRFDSAANATVEKTFAREIETFGFAMPGKFR